MLDNCNVKCLGRVQIFDADTNELVLDKKNAIHPQNMALAIARSLSHDVDGPIYKLVFGNGGSCG